MRHRIACPGAQPALCSFGKQFVGLLLQLETHLVVWPPAVLQQSHHDVEFGNAHTELSHTVQHPQLQVPLGQVFDPVRHWQLTELLPEQPHPPTASAGACRSDVDALPATAAVA
jgi:hypothetical protein